MSDSARMRPRRRGGGARYLSHDHDRQRRLTPPEILEPVRELLGGIDLDPCTEPDNPTGARAFYCLPQDGLRKSWRGARTVWCNPPYGRARIPWVERCVLEGLERRVVLLIPSATETAPWQYAMKRADSAVMLFGRLRFGIVRPTGQEETASHGSTLFGFGVDLSPLAALGVVVQPLTPPDPTG